MKQPVRWWVVAIAIALAWILSFFTGCRVFDPYGWEGVASIKVVAAGDTTTVRRFDDAVVYTVMPGDSVCIVFKAKGSTAVSFLIQEKLQHVFWIHWRTPISEWPALTVVVGGPNLYTEPERHLCS